MDGRLLDDELLELDDRLLDDELLRLGDDELELLDGLFEDPEDCSADTAARPVPSIPSAPPRSDVDGEVGDVPPQLMSVPLAVSSDAPPESRVRKSRLDVGVEGLRTF